MQGGSGNDTLNRRNDVVGNATVYGGPEIDDCRADLGDTVRTRES
jgi:hypothetical protein